MEYAEVLTKVGDWAGSIGIYSLLVECKYGQWALLMVGKFLERLQSLGFSTGVQINFSQQTITVSTHGGSGIVSQLFVHFFLVSSPLALRIR